MVLSVPRPCEPVSFWNITLSRALREGEAPAEPPPGDSGPRRGDDFRHTLSGASRSMFQLWSPVGTEFEEKAALRMRLGGSRALPGTTAASPKN